MLPPATVSTDPTVAGGSNFNHITFTVKSPQPIESTVMECNQDHQCSSTIMESKQTKTVKRKLPQDLSLTDDQLDKKLKEGQNENMVKSEKKAHKAFTHYLSQNGAVDLNYWFFEEPELDNWLAKFWLCVRKEEDDSDSESESQ